MFPGAAVAVDPEKIRAGLGPGETLQETLTSRSERVFLIRRAPRRGKSHVLFLYGNAMTLADTADLREALSRNGHGVVCVDYPGFGLSEGTPSEAGCYRAADAALSVLEERYGVPAWAVDIVGWSLGSAVALQAASQRQVRKLALLSPFSGVATVLLGILGLPETPLGRIGPFAGARRASRVTCPTLMISGELDRMTPTSMAHDLLARIPAPAELVIVPGVGHNDLFAAPEVWQRLLRFLGEPAAA